MKTPSDDLFTLIKSLDTQEKVFFKVYSVKRGSKKNSLSYLKLFDAIDKLKTYDESLLIARLKKTGFKHHLNFAKNYLTEAIFSSLQEYHSDASVNAELHKLLQRADVLITKKLTGLAKKILLKAEKLALEHESYDCLISICSLKAKALSSGMNIKDMENYLNHEAIQEEKYVECVKNIIKFRHLVSQVRLMRSTHSYLKAKDGKHINKINSILASPLLSSPDKALSFSALQDYYYIHLDCSVSLNKFDEETYQRQKKWLTYLESDKKKLADRAHSYLTALINLMLIQIKMGSFSKADKAEKSYERIKYFILSLAPKKRTKILLASFVNATSNYMALQSMRGNPEKSIKVWGQIKDSISFTKLNPNIFVPLCTNLSDNYFLLGNYHEALKWANKILNFKEKNALNVQAMTRIYILLVHYELENFNALPYLAKSAKRFLVKHNYFSGFEEIMIKFFATKISTTNNKQEQIEAFKQLKIQLETLLNNTKQIRALDYFDYIPWIESKIENRPFVEIVRERVRRINKGRN